MERQTDALCLPITSQDNVARLCRGLSVEYVVDTIKLLNVSRLSHNVSHDLISKIILRYDGLRYDFYLNGIIILILTTCFITCLTQYSNYIQFIRTVHISVGHLLY